MAVRVIYYSAADREKHGDLALRRKSFISQEDSFKFENIFELEKSSDGWLITPLSSQSPLFDSDGALIPEGKKISNGFSFNDENNFYKVVSEFKKVPVAKTTKAFNYITALIVAIILFLEVAVVFTLPKQVDGDSNLNREIMVQRCETKIDFIRGKLKVSNKSDDTLLQRQAMIFIKLEMNRVSEFFRENRFRLTLEQLNLFYSNLEKYDQVRQKLVDGLDFNYKEKPNIDVWINKKLTKTIT